MCGDGCVRNDRFECYGPKWSDYVLTYADYVAEMTLQGETSISCIYIVH